MKHVSKIEVCFIVDRFSSSKINKNRNDSESIFSKQLNVNSFYESTSTTWQPISNVKRAGLHFLMDHQNGLLWKEIKVFVFTYST